MPNPHLPGLCLPLPIRLINLMTPPIIFSSTISSPVPVNRRSPLPLLYPPPP